MSSLRILYVTTVNKTEARKIGTRLIEQELCACVNILDGMESLYRWQGNVQSDTECVMLVKTTAEMTVKATDAIKSLHSYDVPCVVSLPLNDAEGNADFLEWLKRSVAE